MLETWLTSMQLGTRNEQVTMQELSSPHDKPLARSRKPRTPLSRNPADWNVRRRDIRKAVVQSNDSSPGPDGIPFGVWRALGHLGIEILLDVAELMEKGKQKPHSLKHTKMNAKKANTTTMLRHWYAFRKRPQGRTQN